jgi:hypothetical protein
MSDQSCVQRREDWVVGVISRQSLSTVRSLENIYSYIEGMTDTLGLPETHLQEYLGLMGSRNGMEPYSSEEHENFLQIHLCRKGLEKKHIKKVFEFATRE